MRPLSGKKVLLVEDEERLRVVVKMMLEELGAEVFPASDQETAIALFKQEGDIDLILLDILLENSSGLTVYDEILIIDPNIRTVLSSGVLPEEDVLNKLKKHGASFIEKPYSLDTLSKVLTDALR